MKKQFGHAFYEEASEEETFEVAVIGTDQKQTFSQREVADIIEARLEEIFLFVAEELRNMGIKELPGGFVLTGDRLECRVSSASHRMFFKITSEWLARIISV